MVPYSDRHTDTHTQIWRGGGGRQKHVEIEREGGKEGKKWEEKA